MCCFCDAGGQGSWGECAVVVDFVRWHCDIQVFRFVRLLFDGSGLVVVISIYMSAQSLLEIIPMIYTIPRYSLYCPLTKIHPLEKDMKEFLLAILELAIRIAIVGYDSHAGIVDCNA